MLRKDKTDLMRKYSIKCLYLLFNEDLNSKDYMKIIENKVAKNAHLLLEIGNFYIKSIYTILANFTFITITLCQYGMRQHSPKSILKASIFSKGVLFM